MVIKETLRCVSHCQQKGNTPGRGPGRDGEEGGLVWDVMGIPVGVGGRPHPGSSRHQTQVADKENGGPRSHDVSARALNHGPLLSSKHHHFEVLT